MTATLTAPVATPTLKFYYNGIKVNGGKLQKAFFTRGADTITIYARDYVRFSAEIRGIFAVENDSDSMTDYFEKDRIRVKKDHPLYTQVLQAYEAGEARQRKMAERRSNSLK